MFADGGLNLITGGGVTVTLDKTIEILEGGAWSGSTGTFNGTGKFVNKTGGTSSTITASNSNPYTLNVEFENLGTFEKASGTGSFNFNGALINNNIINANAGPNQYQRQWHGHRHV